MTLFFSRYFPPIRLAIKAAVALAVVGLCACGGSTVGTVSGSDDAAQSLAFAAALGDGQSEALTVDLSGAQVLPASDTRSTGRASFILDTETRQLYGVLNTSIDDFISVHIHEGGAGEVGAVIASLYQQAGGSVVVPSATYLTPSQAALYNAGKLYIDVHASNENIRGQMSTDTFQAEVSATLSDIQAKVFTPVCSGCHSGGGNTLPSIMDFTSAQATYNSLVGVNSISVDGLLRVEPGDPQQSFLLHKLEGSQSVGSRMPFRGARLNDQTVQSISQWIALGANR